MSRTSLKSRGSYHRIAQRLAAATLSTTMAAVTLVSAAAPAASASPTGTLTASFGNGSPFISNFTWQVAPFMLVYVCIIMNLSSKRQVTAAVWGGFSTTTVIR